MLRHPGAVRGSPGLGRGLGRFGSHLPLGRLEKLALVSEPTLWLDGLTHQHST